MGYGTRYAYEVRDKGRNDQDKMLETSNHDKLDSNHRERKSRTEEKKKLESTRKTH